LIRKSINSTSNTYMKQLFLLFFALLCSAVTASAQSARVQIIHNAPDPEVDVYVNGALALDNFAFRSATPFLDLPAGINLSIAVAPSTSTSVGDAIATFDATFEDGKTYVVAASGIVGDPTTPFTLFVNDLGQETSTDTSKVDISVLHGAPNAPAVDVDAVFVANNVITNLPYGSFTTYLGLTPTVYDFAVRATGSSSVVASYRADLSGLKGAAATVFASGLLGGTPAFGLYAALPDGTVIALPITPTAQVQIIHNSPEPTVDVYAGNTLLLNDFTYRSATPYVTVPADRAFSVGVAPSTSASASDAIYTQQVNFATGKSYTVAASGIVGDMTTPFTLLANAARTVSSDTNLVEINVLHGSTNAPAVDVDAVFVANNVVSNLAYGNFSAYLGVPADKYDFAVRAAGTTPVVASYRADLSGLKGKTATVFASGLLGGTPAFGLYAVLADGTVIALPLTPTAKVQVVHNSPSPTVDVYAGNTLLIKDFAYRNATPYVTVPADRLFTVGVAVAGSSSANDAIYTQQVGFDADKAYSVFASGIVGDLTTPFTLLATEAKQVADNPSLVDLNVLHGSTNAPAVDVDALFVADNLISNLSYSEFSGYLAVPATVYDLAIRPAGVPTVVATFRADISGLEGQSATVFASGLLGGSPAFGLFAVLANGAVLELPLTPTARVQVIHNSPNPTVDVYAGNTLLLNDFAFRTATPFITVPADRSIDFGVAPANSTDVNGAIYTQTVGFEAGKTYSVFASGIVGDPTAPFSLWADEAREAAVDPAKVEFATLHGAPFAPAVDVAVVGVGNIINNLQYGEFAPYIAVDPANYQVQVKVAGTSTVVATYQVNLSSLGGGAARVFASGLLTGSPAFGLFAALPNGTVVEFPLVQTQAFARLQIIHNSPNPTVDVYVNNDKLIDDFAFRTATPFITVPAGTVLNVGVALANSQSVNDVLVSFPVTLEADKTYIATASGIVGNPTTPFTLILNNAAQETAGNPAKIDVAVLHGATNAPPVDVDAVFVAENLVSNLSYGQYTPYLSLDPGVYDLAIRPSGTSAVVATYRADLSGLAGGAAYVFASGLVGGNPGFGLFAALPNGTVIELPITPTTKVQIVHNSPEPTVDIYAGNILILNDFAFRTATPFLDIPADRGFTVGVAGAGSSSVNDVIASFPVNFASGKNYTVFASGVVGNATTPFTLLVDDKAQLSAAPGFTAVSIVHGSPDAPAVDVAERQAGLLVGNLAYGDITPYLNLAPDLYFLDIKLPGTEQIVATFQADLSGADGAALRVFASGFLGGAPGFGLFAVLVDGTVIELPYSPVARLQIIHNSPEPVVDVYVEDFQLLDDFEFRTATPFFYVPAEALLNVGVAPGTSQSVNDVIANFPVTFENGKTYVVVASGLVGGSPAFNLIVNDMGQERAADPSKLELAVLHGAPDAPAVNINSYIDGTPLLTNFQYGDFTPYVPFDADVLLLDVAPTAAPNQSLGIWGGDFTGAEGLAGVVFASGLVSGNPAFDLWVALPDGLTFPLPSFSQVQVIHNSPNPTVDVYLDEEQILDDFQYHDATGVGLLPAGVPFDLSVAPANSGSVDDAIYTLPVAGLERGKSYVIMAAGVVGNATTPFELYVNDKGRVRAESPTNVDLALFHGSPDAPAVDVQLPGGTVLFNDVSFGSFTDYLSVPAASYVVQITPANDNNTIVKNYLADLSGAAGRAATVYASGYLGGQPGFETWVAFADGTTFPLPEVVSTNELANGLSDLSLSPNPTVDEIQVQFNLNQSEALRYAVRDNVGKLMSEGDFGTVSTGEFAQKIRVDNLPAGMYQLEIRSDAGIQTRKFVVQK
jgi:hypothetical protein